MAKYHGSTTQPLAGHKSKKILLVHMNACLSQPDWLVAAFLSVQLATISGTGNYSFVIKLFIGIIIRKNNWKFVHTSCISPMSVDMSVDRKHKIKIENRLYYGSCTDNSLSKIYF